MWETGGINEIKQYTPRYLMDGKINQKEFRKYFETNDKKPRQKLQDALLEALFSGKL